MICPHCGYKAGWNYDITDATVGEKGEFYSIDAHVMTRRDPNAYHTKKEETTLYGCPVCKKAFIE